jgi:predicted outer membrane repeat protein
MRASALSAVSAVLLSRFRRRPIAACVASIFACTPVAAIATGTTHDVTSCFDNGDAGTLRSVIADAGTVSGDTVNLASLGFSCVNSVITLANDKGPIAFNKDLTIVGPSSPSLTIDASALDSGESAYSNIFDHLGSGTLTIQNLGFQNGHVNHIAMYSHGGCIYSKGNVVLDNVAVSSCGVASELYLAAGAGVFASGDVTLKNGTAILDNTIATGYSKGGGLYAGGTLTVQDSSLSGNTGAGKGGGAYAKGTVTLTASFVDNNSASGSGGGVYAAGDISILSSYVSGNSSGVYGGGAYAKGAMTLDSSYVYFNTVGDVVHSGRGGGVYAYGKLSMSLSVISGNKAYGNFDNTQGGGIQAAATTLVTYSTISSNTAYGVEARGGGMHLAGISNTIKSSTISGNLSHADFGGIEVYSHAAVGSSFLMVNSTVSDNTAMGVAGGIYVDSLTTRFYNSTIAFNTANASPGVVLSGQNGSMQATLQSNLMSNNTYGLSGEYDLVVQGDVTINGGVPASSGNNLVRVPGGSSVPTDTLTGVCPLLGRLRNNGGPTRTRALSSHSPAIDTGNNVAIDPDHPLVPYAFDQRGSALVNGTLDYLRVSGPPPDLNPRADIGAYEEQQTDIVFNAAFDDCAPLPEGA